MRKSIAVLMACIAMQAHAATPGEVLQQYAAQARLDNSTFNGFSSERGSSFFRAEHERNGRSTSCATCHTTDPRNSGKTRANKTIEPMAPIANPQRFTDPAKVEKWFSRNCKDVLERACTAQEKGDFIQYLTTVK